MLLFFLKGHATERIQSQTGTDQSRQHPSSPDGRAGKEMEEEEKIEVAVSNYQLHNRTTHSRSDEAEQHFGTRKRSNFYMATRCKTFTPFH